VRANEVVRW